MSALLPSLWPLGAKCALCDKRTGGSVALVTSDMGVFCADKEACRQKALESPAAAVWEWPGWPDTEKPPVNLKEAVRQ